MAGNGDGDGELQLRGEAAGVQNTLFYGGKGRRPGSYEGIFNRTVAFPGEKPRSSCS